MTTILLTGVTAAGKSHLIAALQKAGIERVITVTTRAPRPGEVHGVDYEFVTEHDFAAIEKSGDFAEVNEFAGAKYGTLLAHFEASGHKAVIVDPNGHRNLKALFKKRAMPFVSVFLDCEEGVQASRFMARVMDEVNTARHAGRVVDLAVQRGSIRLGKMLSEEATWRDVARCSESPYDVVIPLYDQSNRGAIVKDLKARAKSAEVA